MMEELKQTLQEGGTKVFTTYAVEIGDALWSALYRHIEQAFPDEQNRWCSKYALDGVFEEENQKFAILCNRANMKYYRLNFSISEDAGFMADDNLIEVTKTYTPAETPQFDADAVANFIAQYAADKEEEEKKEEESEDKTEQEKEPENEDSSEEDKEEKNEFAAEEEKEEICPKCGKPLDECTCEEKKEYSLEEIPEYVELQTQYSALSEKFEQVNAQVAEMTAELETLRAFKLASERKEKEDMIAQFYMLSDEDKQDVIDNIDTYSLDDIEAKLSVICVRNKVSFAQDEEHHEPMTYNLDDSNDDSSTPAWVKAALNVAKSLNN